MTNSGNGGTVVTFPALSTKMGHHRSKGIDWTGILQANNLEAPGYQETCAKIREQKALASQPLKEKSNDKD
jgi:hypothetical protein